MEEFDQVNLQTVNNGAASELFDHHFAKVLGNINDVTIQSDKPRKITLEFTVTPSRDRQSAKIGIKADSKLVTAVEHESSVLLSNKAAYQPKARQMEMFDRREQESADGGAEE